MTVAFDPSSDPSVFDGAELVTLTQPGEPQSLVVSQRPAPPANMEEAEPSGGQYTAADATWHVTAVQLTERPEIGAVLTDSDGQRHTVLEVALESLATRWRLRTRNLAIAGGLDRLVSLRAGDLDQGRLRRAGGRVEPGIAPALRPASSRSRPTSRTNTTGG